MHSNPPNLHFDQCGRLPAAGDNVAIATRRLEIGTRITRDDETFILTHTVLEAHRFVVETVEQGQLLLSWGLPFGRALRDLVPGDALCNTKMLEELKGRNLDCALPEQPIFEDRFEPYELEESKFIAGEQVAQLESPGSFHGFARFGNRGVGTRNYILVLATTSEACAFAEALADRYRDKYKSHAEFDGVVAVTHTEGGGATRPHNLDFIMRTLAGFCVHPNVGAVIAVDYGGGSYTNADLRQFMLEGDYPLEHMPHAFFTIDGGYEEALKSAASIIDTWLPEVAAFERTQQPLAHLRLALQCGGSDAFSGVSGNALAGWLAKELIRNGGCANLAETDELIGAEPYILANVRDYETAARFLAKIEQFQARARLHGASAEGNPSGGNLFRGLYNITLKSIGAGRKKDPDVRLDHVLDYGAPMAESGFYFMDSPGNDLESIAGQAASGANLILFITGNGSITNFPFIPTLKIVTTSPRFDLLKDEMDINAGRYNDGMPMDELGRESFDLAVRVASGERSKGERAGHSQVSIWREWQQSDESGLAAAQAIAEPTGEPLEVRGAQPLALSIEGFETERGFTTDQVGLVMPTSLCSGQVALMIADRLNERFSASESVERSTHPAGQTRFVALAHTEGCGSAGADGLYLETLLGHLRHPFTRRAVLLEHGCEKTHNDAIQHYLESRGFPLERVGLASVQLDGGIESVCARVSTWFDESLARDGVPDSIERGAEALRLGLFSTGAIEPHTARAFGELCAGILAAGGTIVLPENATLVSSAAFRQVLSPSSAKWAATLAYGQFADHPGLHLMASPTSNSSETLTGLGGTGVELMLAHVATHALQGNPMVPLLLVSSNERMQAKADLDLDLGGVEPARMQTLLAELIAETASRRYRPKLFARGFVRFQLTRGTLGISL